MKIPVLSKNLEIYLTILCLIMAISSCSKHGTNPENNNNTNIIDTSNATHQTVTITPAMALPNSAITITGANFDMGNINYIATINGISADVRTIGSNQVLINVPANVTTGKVKLISKNAIYTSSTDFKVQTATFSRFCNTQIEHIAIDATGNIFGSSQNKIYRITPAGVAIAFATVGQSTSLIWGIAVDRVGNVFAASSNDHKIYRITPDGIVSTFAGSGISGYADGQGTSAQFIAPMGLAVDASGNLYTTDSHRVREITASGTVSTIAGNSSDGDNDGTGASASFGTIEGIAVDAAGTVYVSDNKYNKIRKIFQGGFVVTIAGSGTAGIVDDTPVNGIYAPVKFSHPQAIAIDAAGNLFVSDNMADKNNDANSTSAVRMINKSNWTTTFIKNTNTATGAAAVFFTDGIAFDPVGNMYICNTGATTGTITRVIIQ
jgi:serine/threonine-protein kinase